MMPSALATIPTAQKNLDLADPSSVRIFELGIVAIDYDE
jgi:hypothetical protein